MKEQGQSKNKIVRVMASILAILLLVMALFVFVGCDSDTPKIVISIEFNDGDATTNDTYELTYRMNRKYYPQTTRHYLSLIESGFYNDIIIHDYQVDNNKMVTGAFANETAVRTGSGDFKKQPTTLASVWTAADKRTAVPNVLYGETGSNGFSITNGGFTNEKGAIGTYTYVYGQEGVDKDSAFARYVYVNASHNKRETRQIQYLGNTVTTMFYFSTTDTALDNNYCVFAVLHDQNSKNRFNDLMTAIEKVTENQYNGAFTSEINTVNITDSFANRTYRAQSRINPSENSSNTYSNGIFLPKTTIKINYISIKNY